MTQKQEIGKAGEEEAEDYLWDKGYTVIEKNYRQPWGELDIVAKAPDRTLVFVEVKTIKRDPNIPARQRLSAAMAGGRMHPNDPNIRPEENLTKAKLRKLQRTCSIYANSHLELINDKRGWRIDLVAVELDENGLLDIRHYDNL